LQTTAVLRGNCCSAYRRKRNGVSGMFIAGLA
jgi:hypothetical protein